MITAIIDDILTRVNNTSGTSEQSQLRAILASALEKMDIVSRSEFDAQAAVLLRTREKLTELEKKLSILETRLEQ